MRKAFTIKTLSAAAIVIVLLAQVSPVAMELLLCVGDVVGAGCCAEPHDAPDARNEGVDAASRFVDGSDCDCCITVAAVVPLAAANPHKASIGVTAGPARLRGGTVLAESHIRRLPPGSSAEARLVVLRTVVLLI